MPVETTSVTTEQQVSTVEEDSPKQSEPDLPDIELPDDDPNEPTPSTSTNVLTNGLKRPLPDGVDGDKKKKLRLTEVSKDKLEENSNKNTIQLLLQKVTESIENPSDDESNVSNKAHDNLKNKKNSSSNIMNHNCNNGIDGKDCPDKNTLSKDISKERKKYDRSDALLQILSNVEKKFNNSPEFIENSKDTVQNGKNILTKNDILTSNGISCLNKSSSSDNLAITQNSDHENVAAVNDIQETENISTAVNDSTVRESNSNLSNMKIENIVNSKRNDAKPLLELKNKIHLTKNTDETKSIESPCNSNTNNSKKVNVCSNDIDQNFEVIDSDDSSDISSSDLTDLPENIESITRGVKHITQECYSDILPLFSSKELTFEQFDSICAQKITELMTATNLSSGKDRSELQLVKKKERFWRSKYYALERRLKEMMLIVNIHKEELKNNEYAKPHLVTRTVGLQAVLCPRKEGSMKFPRQAIPLPKPDPVSIIVEDDDDVIELETEESASSSTSKITNTTTKKQMPPLVATSKTLVVSPKNVTTSPKNVTASPKNVTTSPKNVTASPKTVTAAKSLNPIDIGTTPTTIDLTGNDDVIEESNIINLEDSISPIKIPRRIPAPLLPAGTLVNGNSGKTITYLELSNNPSSCSSSFLTGPASRSPQRAIVLNKDTINTSPKSKNLNPILIEVSRVDPVLVQPCTVAYTTHRLPVSGTLQPMSTASYTPRKITVSQLSASLKTLNPSYTTCQIPASRVSGSMPGIALPQPSPGTSYTTSRVPISLRSIHQTGSQSPRKPPPPAIPLSGHPSPVPGIPNQKSLPTWKRLPPAPKLTISKSSDVQNNMAQALVLSWNMNMNRTNAEVISYQIYAYQETPDQPPNIALWKKIGDVKALALPMACSLTHFSNGQKYHFLVRAVDVYTRVGPFSKPESIL